MFFRQLIDPCLGQYSYMIACQGSKEAIVIDAERDVDRYLQLADRRGFNIVAVAETHIHADFLAGSRELAEKTGAHLYLSAEGESEGWTYHWAKNSDYKVTFLKDGDTFKLGGITFKAIFTPGHTPEHLCFLVTDAGQTAPIGIISGDFLFAGDLGRPDLLETAAHQKGTQEKLAAALYESSPKVDEWPEHILVWPGHGEGSSCGKGMGAVPVTTAGYEQRTNKALGFARQGRDSFISYILDDQPEPPMYFARMKQLNRDGVPVLGQLPTPAELSVQELRVYLEQEKPVIVDTRSDRLVFMSRHLPGSLFMPLDNIFCTAAGSVIEDPEAKILLVGSRDRCNEAVRRLVRVGYDNIDAFVTLDTLYRYMGPLPCCGRIEMIDFMKMEEMRKNGAEIIDVRYESEFEQGHVPGAINAPYTRLVERLSDFTCKKDIAVHCGTGLRAALAGSYLASKGFKVSVVNDLFSHYEQNFPVEKGLKLAAE